MNLKWTREYPAVDGWYWLKENRDELKIVRCHRGLVTCSDWVDEVGFDELGLCLWFGPIPTPDPPDPDESA